MPSVAGISAEQPGYCCWQDRTVHRLDRYRRLARWLKRDGILGAGWSIEQATSFLWSLTSVQTYDQLVVERGLSIEHYAALLRTSLRTTLTTALQDAARSHGHRADPPTASGASSPDMQASD